ncbi:MAG: hypothetical protein AMXMBFR84_32770 [Candidatus Hydrogenedentota bacterium]
MFLASSVKIVIIKVMACVPTVHKAVATEGGTVDGKRAEHKPWTINSSLSTGIIRTG